MVIIHHCGFKRERERVTERKKKVSAKDTIIAIYIITTMGYNMGSRKSCLQKKLHARICNAKRRRQLIINILYKSPDSKINKYKNAVRIIFYTLYLYTRTQRGYFYCVTYRYTIFFFFISYFPMTQWTTLKINFEPI